SIQTFTLTPRSSHFLDEDVLFHAWKKTRHHMHRYNSYTDTLALDLVAVSIHSHLSSWRSAVHTHGAAALRPAPMRLVPAPKSTYWTHSPRWAPAATDGDLRLRPLAHLAIRDQVFATTAMMAMASAVETRQGDPSTPIDTPRRSD